MSDERGRGAADEGRPTDAGEPASGADAQEPEFGSSEWLLQQLTGGRRVGRRSAERDDEAGQAEAAAAVAEEPAAAVAEEPAAVQDAVPAPEEIAPAASDTATSEPAAFDELLGSAVVPEESPAAVAPAESVPETQTEFPVAFNWNLTPGEGVDPLVEPEREPEPARPEPEPEPSVDVPAENPEPDHDGAAEAQAAAWASFQTLEAREAAEAQTPEPEVEQPRAEEEADQPAWSVFDALVAEGPAQDGTEAPEESAAPVAPEPEPTSAPEYRSPLFEPTDAEEPEPPTVETPIAAGSWVIPPAEPPVPAEPEQPRTIFDAPPAASTSPAADDADERGHGLAALLGFGAPGEGEQSARSVIGDTTSIIPLVPGAVPPAPAPATPPPPVTGPATTEPPSSEWAGSHQPDPWLDRLGHADPAPPTNPVLPPIDAAALFEPATDTAAHRAAAPELDALLRSESRPEPPTLPAEHSLPSEPEPSEPEPVEPAPFEPAPFEPQPFATEPFETAPTAAFPAVLPSEPEIPAAEAEVALGGVPSPATSPIDAASIAAASETAAFEAPTAAEETSDAEEPDGLAELFGDVAPIDDATTDTEAPETGSADTEDEPPVPARDEALDEAEQEPAAALEGPQLAATVPFFLPSSDALGDTALGQTEEADGIDDAAATGGPAADAPDTPAAPATAATVWPAATGAAASATPADAQTSAPVTASTSPSAAVGPTAAPAGPGLWGSRNNRILFSVAGGLAVLLVLIGLFALGTRIPSLFGAAKPVPAPTASTASATPKPTPTPTPVPAVTPKPAPVGAGTHPWDALGGGECIQPFTTVWAQEFTVVDCATPHTAQLVYTNLLSADPAAPYPGADALAGQVPGLCTASGVVDLNAAGAYPDLQVIGSFPATEQQWKDGQRSYYCFVNRSGGEPLTSSVAGPGPTG